jgi:alginate biosynthesis protein AlgX
MLHAPLADGPSFFPTDYRMTSSGAAREAKAIGDVIVAASGYADMPKGRFDTSPAGKIVIDSAMRSVLQRHCLLPLPLAETDAYSSNRVQGGGVAKDNSLFGSTGNGARVAIVGTEVDGDPIANLAGFVAKATGLETSQYAVAGGGGFAAISTYLTSSAFQDARPAFLIWTNPINENLASFGDQPFAELIAAAGDNCRVPLPVMVNLQANSVVADLSSLDAGQAYTLFVDASGAPASQAQFDFTASNGLIRTKSIFRSKDQVKTGRFYMPMTSLWPDGAQSVEITLDVPLGNAPRVLACFN